MINLLRVLRFLVEHARNAAESRDDFTAYKVLDIVEHELRLGIAKLQRERWARRSWLDGEIGGGASR